MKEISSMGKKPAQPYRDVGKSVKSLEKRNTNLF